MAQSSFFLKFEPNIWSVPCKNKHVAGIIIKGSILLLISLFRIYKNWFKIIVDTETSDCKIVSENIVLYLVFIVTLNGNTFNEEHCFLVTEFMVSNFFKPIFIKC